MLEHWLKPLPRKTFAAVHWRDDQIGGQIQRYLTKMPDLNATKLVLVGIEQETANRFRQFLYKLSINGNGQAIADLGNVRNADPAFLIPLLAELLNSGLCPILIGPEPGTVLAQYKAFLERQQLISLVSVDQQLPFHPEGLNGTEWYLSPILLKKKYKPFYFGVIGAQGHQSIPRAFEWLAQENYDCFRLGNARANLRELEPIIRNADLLSFNLAALKHIEAPAQLQSSPSGFFLEEACQISWYAGMSDKLKCFGLYGYQTGTTDDQSLQSMALLIWYFMDGFFNRKGDYPSTTEGLIEYIVDQKELNQQLTFWKSKRSGRWWLQVPVQTSDQYERHRLIPCSYNDYKMATQEDLPDRLFNAFKRF